MNKKTIATIGLCMIAIIWGTAFIAVDDALINGWETFPILMVRGLLGGLIALPFAIRKQFWKHKETIKNGLIMGFVFFLAYTAQTFGQQISNVVNSAFLTALYVVFAPLILRLIYKKKQDKRVYYGSLVAIIGVLFLTVLDSSGGVSFNFGDVLLIFCAFFFALQIVYASKCKGCDPLSITFIQLTTMGVLSLIMMFVTNQTYLPKE